MSGGSMWLERAGSHRKTNNYILIQCLHNLRPKCSLSPYEPVFFLNICLFFASELVPYIYIDFIYEYPRVLVFFLIAGRY